MTTSTYLLDSARELERLRLQSRVWEPAGRELLESCGAGTGLRALDVGCGALGWLRILSAWVGPAGHVVGTDVATPLLAAARALIDEDALANVEVVHDDLFASDLEPGAFDLVHARTLLINIINPDEIIIGMKHLARPGGTVAVQEPDTTYWVCDPPHPAWDRLIAAYQAAYRLQGRDFAIGRRLGRLLNQAALQDVNTHAHVFKTRAGDVYQKLLIGVADAARRSRRVAGDAGSGGEPQSAADTARPVRQRDRRGGGSRQR